MHASLVSTSRGAVIFAPSACRCNLSLRLFRANMDVGKFSCQSLRNHNFVDKIIAAGTGSFWLPHPELALHTGLTLDTRIVTVHSWLLPVVRLDATQKLLAKAATPVISSISSFPTASGGVHTEYLPPCCCAGWVFISTCVTSEYPGQVQLLVSSTSAFLFHLLAYAD